MKLENHKFYDSIAEVRCSNTDHDCVTLKIKATPWLFLSKEDVEAMAKHFKLID